MVDFEIITQISNLNQVISRTTDHNIVIICQRNRGTKRCAQVWISKLWEKNDVIDPKATG